MSSEIPSLQVDRTYELTVGPITRTQIVRFAGAGGDFNPMHHDEEFARAAGQPTVFAMGQLQAALLARLASDWLGIHALRRLAVRFVAKVWPGDVLVLRGVVEEEVEVDGERRVSCVLEAENQSGEIVARGTVTACYGVNDR
jgi:3-hydroxybutyryl-CoA dehydratase